MGVNVEYYRKVLYKCEPESFWCVVSAPDACRILTQKQKIRLERLADFIFALQIPTFRDRRLLELSSPNITGIIRVTEMILIPCESLGRFIEQMSDHSANKIFKFR